VFKGQELKPVVGLTLVTAGLVALDPHDTPYFLRNRWVPWVAYGLAGLVGFSRVPLQAHFPSDVFAGAALGYAISHYVVLRQQ
jgi:membrane-associated phospholipid phosphatase